MSGGARFRRSAWTLFVVRIYTPPPRACGVIPSSLTHFIYSCPLGAEKINHVCQKLSEVCRPKLESRSLGCFHHQAPMAFRYFSIIASVAASSFVSCPSRSCDAVRRKLRCECNPHAGSSTGGAPAHCLQRRFGAWGYRHALRGSSARPAQVGAAQPWEAPGQRGRHPSASSHSSPATGKHAACASSW